MKRLLLLCASIIMFVFTAIADDLQSIAALAQRVVPQVATHFVWEKLPQKGGDRFELCSRNGKIVIAGNNANSMAVGLNHYLKYYCLTEVSWFATDEVSMPEVLPDVPQKVSQSARVENRFFLNYCTYGYTMPWWNWRDWERLIDYMALNGVNMPLAITGQESIWYKVWTELGLSDREVRSYFCGPGHLPWHRMLNIDYWQGPLPKSWLDNQEALQKQIVTRERELNMRPILPAFAGHVPQELTRIYPDAKISKLAAWAGFEDKYACSFLDPMDPLFKKIQKIYLAKQKEMFGTDHIYGIDLFNELTPPSWDPSYLNRVSGQVYSSLKEVDHKAVWLQMGWLFYFRRGDWTNERVEAYLKGAPQKNQLLLDYYCEACEVWPMTKSFFGTPFIWCYLGNFGGNHYLNGNFGNTDRRLEKALNSAGKNLNGIGSTLESFDLNPFMFEYVFEKSWNGSLHHNIPAWVEALADQRAGRVDSHARHAWQILADSLYQTPYSVANANVMMRPRALGQFKFKPDITKYNRVIIEALDELLQVNSHTAAYRFDVVNLTRELMNNCFSISYARYEKAVAERNLGSMLKEEYLMRQILSDMDCLLSTNSTFLMGKWIADARALGTTEEEKNYYEQNARCLLTTWGEEGASLNDYARRMWSGLVSSFYAERWSMFFGAVKEAVIRGEAFDNAKYAEYRAEVTHFETLWWQERIGSFNSQPVGDEIQTVSLMLAKYRNQALKQ